MTIREIIKKHLEDNGFVGLCSYECGCDIDDLMPCMEHSELCEPAKYKYKTEDGDFIYTNEKKEAKDDTI